MSKTIKLLLLMIVAVNFQSNAQLFGKSKKEKAKEDTEAFRYEVFCEGVGVAGTSLIKIYSYASKPKLEKDVAKRNAIHAIIFKGYIGTSGCSTQKPLARDSSVEIKHKDYFDVFFKEGGEYLKYVNLTNDGSIGSGDIQKIGKKQYKIGVVVSVSKDELRKKLEEDGIIKGLSHGF